MESKHPDNLTDAESAADPQQAHVRISNHVQNVYYRNAASEQARVLGLRGTVRNLPTSEVELIAEGPQAALQQLIAWCHLGPPAARVESVEVRFAEATGEYPDFRVLRQPNTVPRSAADSSD